MQGEGWRRLWELVKWLVSIGIGLFMAFYVIEMLQAVVPEPSTSQPTPGQIVSGGLVAGGIIGLCTFGLLSAVEWVYRGFRPSHIAPTEADQPPPQGEPEASPEPRLALGHQETQQRPSAYPTHLQEPVQRD